jgi:hypothetical protein
MTRLREQIVRAKAENIKYIVIVIYQTTNKYFIVKLETEYLKKKKREKKTFCLTNITWFIFQLKRE